MNSIQTDTEWSDNKKVVFRFFFIFLLSFVLFFNNGAFFFLRPFSTLFSEGLSDTVSWVGLHMLGLPDVVLGKANGSGDKLFNYVLLFCLGLLAVIGSLIWHVLDRQRKNYVRMYYWLTCIVRYYVGLMLIQYGIAKVAGGQFSSPDVARLSQTFGESTPMGLAWTFFGYSEGYKWFMAAAEFLAVLLLFRRTMVAGAIISLGTALNIMAVNYFFDVPVKIISTALVVMCLFLLLPQWRALYAFFVLGQSASLTVVSLPAYNKRWKLYTKHAVKGLLILWTISLTFAGIAKFKRQYTASQLSHPLAGSYEAIAFKKTGKELGGSSWKEVRLLGQSATIFYRDGSSIQCAYFVNSGQKTLDMFLAGLGAEPEVFTYAENKGQLVLEGEHRGQRVKVTLKKIQPGDFTLMKTGFNWFNEVPNNR